ncbi:hypothetical protein [Streptosporangium pseudovulgare]|uniref:Uncharacterized protein n=1 Tax=Streptosporangium pseudovulgare TaxID=35765 RepID=A0ABQ2QSW4_9ACTN|nr:hypothetical protein [Streptosporangium pseudovulgare]GGP94922.1 hypothetical protein GCM10010140_26020 [Streptosporangium pseudovulgare]
MKRWIIVAATALAVPTAAVPAAAKAAPADPVAALEARFVAGHGVRIVESGRTYSGRELLSAQKRRGTVEFGPSGVAGHDVLSKSDLPGDDATPLRTRTVGGDTYLSGGMIGRKWVRSSTRAASPFFTPVMLLEPATLKSLLPAAKKGGSAGKKAGPSTFKGTTTLGALYRVSPSYRASLGGKRPAAAVAATKVSWRLWLGRDRLPARLVTSWAVPPRDMRVTRVSDVRFASWGTPVTLTAPAPAPAPGDAGS